MDVTQEHLFECLSLDLHIVITRSPSITASFVCGEACAL